VRAILDQQKSIEAHVTDFFKGCPVEIFSWEIGNIKESHPFFRVIRVRQEKKWIYISNGASISKRGGNYGCEFFIITPIEDPLMVELLAMVAHYHSAPEFAPLDVGTTVAIGQPWVEGSVCNNLLVSLPYPFGPPLEWLHISKDTHVRFAWLVPITDDEVAYAQEHGVEALEDIFEKAQLNCINVNRCSVLANGS